MSYPENHNKHRSEFVEIMYLKAFFKTVSTFSLRWKKTWKKDYISPGIYYDEFLNAGYKKKDLKKYQEKDWIAVTTYQDPKTGSRRSALILKIELQAQMTPFKRILSGDVTLSGIWKDFKKWCDENFKEVIIFLLTFLFVFFFYLNHAHSMSRPKLPDYGFEYQGNVPLGSQGGRFIDPETKTACYWMARNSDVNLISLQCVKIP